MEATWGAALQSNFKLVLGDSLAWLTSSACDAPAQTEVWWSRLLYFLLAPCPQHLLVIGVHLVFLVVFLVSSGIYFKKQGLPGFPPSTDIVRTRSYLFDATATVTFLVTMAYWAVALHRLLLWVPVHGSLSFEAFYPAYLGSQALAWALFLGTLAYEKKFGSSVHLLPLRVWWVVNFVLSVFGGVAAISRLVLGVEDHAPLSLKVDDCFVALTFPATTFLFIVSLRARGSTGIYVIGSSAGLSEPLLNGERKESNASGFVGTHAYDESYYAQAGLFSRILWLWMNPLLKLGSKSTLQLNDVPLLAPQDRAEWLYSVLQSHFPKDLAQSALGWTLLKCFWKWLLLNGFLNFLRVSVMYVGPILITQFVDFASGVSGQPVSTGYLLVLILLAAKCTEVLASHHYNFNSQRLGMRVRSSMITTVYRKGLRLSSAGRQAHGIGQIVNYMTVDVQQLSDSVLQLHNLWALPLQVLVALIILYGVVGVSMLAGLATMLGFLVLSITGNRNQRFCQINIMKHRDSRMKATTEVLNCMKIIKLQAWEEHFRQMVENLRSSEYGWLRKFFFYTGTNIFLLWISASVVSVVTFTCAALIGYELTPARVFTATATFRILQEPVRAFPQALIAISQALVSLDRLDKFMQSEELDTAAVSKVPEGEKFAISVEGGSFTWDSTLESPTLSNINVHIQPGSLVAIVGMVGSGKSSILSSFLGEMPKLAGKVTISGTTAYVPQTAWIQNGTIQENILFGKSMDKVKYAETVRVCSLERDLELMEFGDQTEIGERGINLSGGQKQRIQLARAVYQDCDLYLLDDVFSAVDAHTGSELFKKCILGTLASKTRVLVTHQVEFLHGADQILVMRDGMIVQSGKYNDLLQAGTQFDVLVQAHNDAMDSVDTENGGHGVTSGYGESTRDMLEKLKAAAIEPLDGTASPPRGSPRANGSESISPFQQNFRRNSREKTTVEGLVPKETPDLKKGTAKLIDEETRETGGVGRSVYWLYVTKAYGWQAVVAVVVIQFVWQALLICSDYWLAYETSPQQAAQFRAKTFILGYLYLAIGVWVCLLLRIALVLSMGIKSSQSFFSAMLRCVFRAPMSFFDTTPSGRILSRSSSDQTTVDIMLPFFCSGSLALYSAALATLFVICQVTWQCVFVIVPLGYIYFSYQSYFIATSRELTRIDSVTKAPVIHHFSESVAGFAVIRSFGKEKEFSQVNVERVDSNIRLDFHNNAANEWLGFRLEMIGTIILCTSALLLVVLPRGYLNSDLVGLSLSYGLALNTCLYWSVWLACMVENKMVSVERIRQFSVIPSEAPLVIQGAEPSPDWPHNGEICIRDLQLRYRSNTPLILKGISVTIKGGQKVGVVGRTGSGKSTLLQAVFRLIEPSGGRIIIDGVDICALGLTDLRSRLSIIPQEPTLFEGSIRMNLDPLDLYTDEQIWEVLARCQLERVVRDQPHKLDSQVVGNGENWSVGQRQLLCLGRVLLKRSRILFLDEATASVDSHTDGIIQKTVREEFHHCTLVSIAHRIPTVMDSDRVLVIDAGKVKEYDSPSTLLQQQTSLFGALVREYSTRSGNSS